MKQIPKQRIDPRSVSYWRLSAAINCLFLLLLPIGFYATMRFWNWPGWIGAILLVFILLTAIFYIFFKPQITWQTWRYEISQEEIDLFRGVFIKKRTLIPMVRVQHVDTKQGPLLRYFGLSTVTISTAAGTHEIPALADQDAALLRDRISELARVVDEDV